MNALAITNATPADATARSPPLAGACTGLVHGLVIPRGPRTSVQSLNALTMALGAGVLAGWTRHSRVWRDPAGRLGPTNSDISAPRQSIRPEVSGLHEAAAAQGTRPKVFLRSARHVYGPFHRHQAARDGSWRCNGSAPASRPLRLGVRVTASLKPGRRNRHDDDEGAQGCPRAPGEGR
jgi:hypothetical protein